MPEVQLALFCDSNLSKGANWELFGQLGSLGND